MATSDKDGAPPVLRLYTEFLAALVSVATDVQTTRRAIVFLAQDNSDAAIKAISEMLSTTKTNEALQNAVDALKAVLDINDV